MPFFDKNKKKEKNTHFELHPKNLDKKIYLLGLRAFYSTFLKNRFFIFTEKWHNNSIDKKRQC